MRRKDCFHHPSAQSGATLDSAGPALVGFARRRLEATVPFTSPCTRALARSRVSHITSFRTRDGLNRTSTVESQTPPGGRCVPPERSREMHPTAPLAMLLHACHHSRNRKVFYNTTHAWSIEFIPWTQNFVEQPAVEYSARSMTWSG